MPQVSIVTADLLIDAITALGVDHLDYICLTHIHLDHAGAIGHLVRHFPDALVVCHPKGASHLVDPERLWQGTVKTLGATGRAYGRFVHAQPVPLNFNAKRRKSLTNFLKHVFLVCMYTRTHSPLFLRTENEN